MVIVMTTKDHPRKTSTRLTNTCAISSLVSMRGSGLAVDPESALSQHAQGLYSLLSTTKTKTK